MRSFASRVALLAALAAVPASAQVDRPEYLRALAAGYEAAFFCSDIFNAGMSEVQVDKDDLRRIYPELEPFITHVSPDVDRANRRVTVRFSDFMPPRVAQWRPHLGCSQLPIGAPVEDAARLPRLDRPPLDLQSLDARPWPMGDRGSAGAFRGDVAALGRTLDAAFDRRSYGQGSETTAVLIVQGGRIVAERYRADFDMHMSQRTWSVAKSIAGTLLGVAQKDGLLSLEAPAPVPEWSTPGDPRGAITTRLLLRMNSGLNSDHPGNRTDALYFGGVSVSDTLSGLPLTAPPGRQFRYSNNDIVAAVRGLSHVLGDGERALAYPFDRLFWRIGMTRTVPETDWRGQFILSSQVWTTARDLARLGLLYLRDGVWNGDRVLPAGWTKTVRAHGAAQPERGFGYGLTWWTFPEGSGVPAEAIIAQGNRGQYLAVIPSRDLVVVRRGFDGPGAAFDPAAFVKDVLAALH